MVKQSLPAVSILDKDTITDFKTADSLVVIAYLDAEDKESTETFSETATTLRNDFLFGSTTDPALTKAEGVKAPSIVIYKSFDEPRIVYDGKLIADEIEQFIKSASVPLIGEVGPETYSGYIQSGLPLAYIFCDSEESKTKLTEAIRPIALKFKGKINFGTLDAVAYGAHASNLNLEVGKWPAFAIQETVKNSKFPYDQDAEITEETISKFVQDYSDGKIEPSIKSEPIPEKQEGPVHVVVAHSYDEIVIGSDKDVLLEFYAPWCGHCKNLAPKYEELASLYFNNPEYSDKVIVAKIDATANDTPDEIQGFPTIKLYPAGKKDSPLNYEGDRTVEDMANFIRDSGSHKIDAWVPPPEVEEEKEEEKVDEQPEEPVGKSEEETVKEEDVVEKVKEAVKSAVADDDAVSLPYSSLANCINLTSSLGHHTWRVVNVENLGIIQGEFIGLERLSPKKWIAVFETIFPCHSFYNVIHAISVWLFPCMGRVFFCFLCSLIFVYGI